MSFIYDIADLYKAKYTIPLAFEVTKNIKSGEDVAKVIRHKMKELFLEVNLVKMILSDLKKLFQVSDFDVDFEYIKNLWDEKGELTPYGVSYIEK